MLKQRLKTAVIAIVVLFVVLFVLPEVATRAVIAGVILLAAWEWGGFLAAGERAQRVACVGVVAALVGTLFFGLQQGIVTPEQVFVVALLWWLAALLWLSQYPTPVPHWLAWLAAALVLLPAWLALDMIYRASPLILLFMLVLVWAADIGAYFAGKRFGRVKLAPKVSPNKTWEGVLGGLLLVVAISVCGGLVLGLSLPVLVPLCVSIALLSVVGDLTVSAFKRSVNMKDSGSLFPGHGGLLDRIVSVTAAAPLFALGMTWAGLA